MLGLGASGPQVIEGFHGVPYDAPIARIREVIQPLTLGPRGFCISSRSFGQILFVRR